MKRLSLLLLAALLCLPGLVGAATGDKQSTVLFPFVEETRMQSDLMQMLARFSTYMKNDFQECAAPNSVGEACGCFRGENTMGSDERGVRPNADMGMLCAFLVKYGRQQTVLPDGVGWNDLEQMAMKSLVFAYSTHKANRLKVCVGNRYWGSTSVGDHSWESSLWAMSVAYCAFFLWDRLSAQQRGYVYNLLKAECNYELERDIPTGYEGDTKAEENGWEADVLAATLGLFPNDELAPQWFARLREFAINSYSQRDDATDTTVIDPHYDRTTVADLYRGANLYDDFTLQNHNYFHTSYQNVVVQELGEAALALKLFQQKLHGEERWHTNALMHNCDRVMRDVLYWLALPDGELAMPNGNDWSLFLYDQITSYSTNACFLRDPHALMLENRAYQMIKARQLTTPDGSWLLRPDVDARRMGVEGHRVMMTWLMHELMPTGQLVPTSWDDFCREFAEARVIASQNIVRASSPSRFTCFSWSKGLRSYTGYIAPYNQQPNLIVPFRANNTGNFLGWYEVKDKKTSAEPTLSGHYQLDGNAYVMNGALNVNERTLDHRFALYSTPGNAVVYMDEVRTLADVTITAEKGGLMAVSTDPLTTTERTLYTAEGQQQTDGKQLMTMKGPWVNIDNLLGIVVAPQTGEAPKQIAFGEQANCNSVLTSKLYASYSAEPRQLRRGEVADRRVVVYYSNVDAAATARMAAQVVRPAVADGWNCALVPDPDGISYLLLSRFSGTPSCTLEGITLPQGAPVLPVPTTIGDSGSRATFSLEENRCAAAPLRFFVQGQDVLATPDGSQVRIQNQTAGKNRITLTVFHEGHWLSRQLVLRKKTLTVGLKNGKISVR